MSARAVSLALLIVGAVACEETTTDELTYSRRLEATLTQVRLALESRLGTPVPSLSALVNTGEASYFASSASTSGDQITADTYFRFASNTKTFTAAAILKMHQDGWLDYRARIRSPMPGSDQTYADPRWTALPNGDAITIEQLLQHSAGVFDVDNDTGYSTEQLEADPNHQFCAEEFVAQATKPYFAPGTDYHYSNTGYYMLGEIIARVYSARSGARRTYGDYLREHLYGPGTKVPLPVGFPEQASDRALPTPSVCSTIRGLDGLRHVCDNNETEHIAEGNGYGTLRALDLWVRTLLSGRNALTPALVERMMNDLAPNKIPTTRPYGLGCLTLENLGYGHDGASVGYLSQMVYDPKTNVSVVTLLPFWDETSMDGLKYCVHAVHDAGWAAREVFGYPGDPG
jgi:D-alanyl-D-alanine carboxypeptidase